MATFIKEDSAKKLGKEVNLPDKLTDLMKNKSNYYGEIDPKLQGYKRAKKIASAADKEKYNTDKDKFKKSTSGVTLNYNEVKRWNNALKHLPKNSDAFDANGGEEAKEMVGDLMKQVRRDSQKVEMVPEVEKLVKDIKTNDKQLKPTKISSADVYISENKKVYLQENQLQVLKEYYNQLTLPFDGEYHEISGKTIPTKMNYEYFVDWLEHIGRYGELNWGNEDNTDPTEIVNSYLSDENTSNEIYEELLDNLLSNEYLDYDLKNIVEELMEQYPIFFNEEVTDMGPDDIKANLKDAAYDSDVDSIRDYLNDKGCDFLEKKLKRAVLGRIDEEGFIYGMKTNENGLIYVERVITLPPLKSYNGAKIFDGAEDFFKALDNSYSGVGDCWTWSAGEGEAYCGGGGEDVTMKGWVRPTGVNWCETIFLNGYELNYEKEIRMYKGAAIQIDEVETDDGKKLPLKGPIIIHA